MQRESRVKKTLLNARVNLLFYFLTLVLSFFSRKIFLDCLGADFIGLTGTLQNLLGFLNLAELGIGTAIGYLLFKPLYDNDQAKINDIISVMGYLYRWIGFFILSGGVILSSFLPFIFPKNETGFSISLIYFAYYSFLVTSLIGYFINYKQTLLGADQRNYVITGYYQSTLLIKTVIQMLMAKYTKSYILWISIEILFGIVYSFILNWKINQTYPWLRAEIAHGRKVLKKYPEVITKTKQLFIHKMIPFTQYQCSSFLVYAFVSLQTVAYYGNYTIILDKITQLVNNFYNSLSASVGNLIAEGDIQKIYRIYWELLSARFLVAGSISFAIFYLVQPFISLWLGNKYLLDNTIILLISINIFIRMTREATDPFLFGSGLFQDIFAPIVEIVVFFVVAIIGGYFWGLAGIIWGGIVSMFIIGWCWKPYFLYTRLFDTPVYKTLFTLGKYITVIIFATLASTFICSLYSIINPYSSFLSWILYAVLIYVTYVVIGSILLLTLTRGFKDFVNRFFKTSF